MKSITLPWRDRIRAVLGRPINVTLPAQASARRDGTTRTTVRNSPRAQSGYSMAITDRLTEDWQATTITSDSLLVRHLVTTRNRSRFAIAIIASAMDVLFKSAGIGVMKLRSIFNDWVGRRRSWPRDE